MITHWKLTLEYDGSKYRGWQEQVNARTVQGELKKAAAEYFGREVDIQGAGRTDAGVHALVYVASMRVDVRSAPAPEHLMRTLNDLLPSDIAVLAAERSPAGFHARRDALTRCYIYQIATRKTAFSKKHVWWVKESLDTDVMARAANSLAGRHDFICFRALDPSKPGESTVVVVESAGIEVEPDMIVFRIEASHFLWRMVRRLVGTLVRLGRGEITEADFAQLLEGKCDKRFDIPAWTAPAAGLFFERVKYQR